MPTPRSIRFYVPPQAPDLDDRIKKAAEAASKKQMRTVSVSEWLCQAAVEKLEREMPAEPERPAKKK